MRELLEKFFQYYLVERDIDAILGLSVDNVLTVGTGDHEIGRGKEEFRILLQKEFAEIPGMMQYETSDYSEMLCAKNVGNMIVKLKILLHLEDRIMEMRSRLTCSCIKEDGEWKFTCLHMSVPDKEQAKDSFFPLYYGKSAVGKLSPESEAKLAELISDTLPGGIMGGYMEEGFPLYTINKKMLDILGYSYEELSEISDQKMLHIIYEDDRDRVEEYIWTQIRDREEYETDYRVVGKNGKIIWVNDIGKKIVTENGRDAIISIMTDISERIKREAKLKKEAEQDSLTKLNNRKTAVKLINEEFKHRDGGCLFICDVDHFKSVNDTRGHAAGDKVLRKLAAIIKRRAGESAITARLGGDEYILFFPENVSKENAIERIRTIQQEFLLYMKEETPELNVSLSAGGAQRTHKEDIHHLYAEADTALYRAKQNKGELQMNEGYAQAMIDKKQIYD